MSSRIHRVPSVFPQAVGPKTTAKESETLPPAAKSGKAFNDLDMNQLSPPANKQALPSPPTSTPTHEPPASLRKRKSVIFNDHHLRSVRSVPNHRSRAQTIADIPRTTTYSGTVQPPLFSSSHSHADQLNRARLSLAAPQLAIPTSPSASRNRESSLRRLEARGSPLGARSAAKKKLARFYYNPSFLHQVPRRATSPTLSTSAGSKQAGRRHPPDQMLTDKDLGSSKYSDESSDSDDEVASALLNDSPDTRRSSSCSRIQRLRDELDDDPAEELAELRPILKKTPAEILLADTVQQATAKNGRPRISLDPIPFAAYRRAIAAVTAKASRKTIPSSSGDASSRTSTADVTASFRFNRSANSSHNSRKPTNAPSANTSTVGADCPNEDSHSPVASLSANNSSVGADRPDEDSRSHGGNPPSDHGHSDADDSNAIEAFLLSSARSCLVTLQASLVPPPDQMRLDPVSPLAKLTSPQKLKLGKLGTLDGSPREPRGVLPRAPICNPRLESRKNQPRRSWLSSTAILADASTSAPIPPPVSSELLRPNQSRTRGRSWHRSTAKLPESATAPPPAAPVTSGPLRTPDSSPIRQAQPLPRVAITLREVEDAYILLHDHLDALMRHWQETGQPGDKNQQVRLAPLFADDVGAALMKCLVREVENLCRHDDAIPPEQPNTTSATSNQAPPCLRDDISRMMVRNPTANPIFSALNDAPALPPAPVNKSGASTNEIRRRVAEIETGQAALRFIAMLWSWPGCMTHFDDSYTQRLLSLLVQIPKSTILRRKKNLLAIGLLNHIFKLQRLNHATLEPHVSAVVDAIASTLYLSAGKSGDKGQKVLCLGLAALQQLTTQVPQHIAPKIGKFLEPLLASLTAPDSSILRHQASAGLGALVNCTKQDWNLSPKNPARVQVHQLRATADALVKLQQDRKEAFKEKLSTCTLAYYNDKNTFFRWALLCKQLKRALAEGDGGWVISVMATMLILLGKRIRKLDPPLTRVFMPIINHLLKDSRTNHLASQLWDYYICVMFQWSTDCQTQSPEQVWALDPVQLPFFLQLFRSAYFVPAADVPSPTAATSSAPTHTANNSDPYKSLLQPNKDPSGTDPHTNRAVPETSHPSAGLSENPHCQSPDTPQPSSHHLLLAAYLYGAIGYIKHVLPHPPVCLSLPSELLAAAGTCSRFRYLDIAWDEMVEPFLPNILAGPHDEHRLYAYDILGALLSYESADSPHENRWTLERFIHPVYHQPPTEPESSTRICVEEFTNLALSSVVVPAEIPALDPLWICSRYDKVLRLVAASIGSIQHIKNLQTGNWLANFPVYAHRPGHEIRVGPRSMFRVWQELVKSVASVYQTCDWIFDTRLSDSVCAMSETLERSIRTPAPLGSREERHAPNIFLFRNLYVILRHGMGVMLMNRKLITINDGESPEKTRKISLFSKTLSFVFTSSVAAEIANTLGPEDWIEYGVVTQTVMDDFISAQKVVGFNERLYDLINDLSDVLQACTEERLQLLFGTCSMKIVTEFMKIVEPGVLLDEPSLKPTSAIMIGACFKSILQQDAPAIDPATRKQFVKVFTEFLARLTQGSLKTLLDGCQTRLVEYIKNGDTSERALVYSALLSKLRKADLLLMMSPLELSALIVSPFQSQSSLATVSPNKLISFVKKSPPATLGGQGHIVRAKNSPVPAPSSSSVSPLPTAPCDDTRSISSKAERSAESHHLDNDHGAASQISSIPAELCNRINESQAPSSIRESSKAQTIRDSSGPTRVSPVGKLTGDMRAAALAKSALQELSHRVPAKTLDPSTESRVESPAQDHDHSESLKSTAESLNVSGNGLVKQSQRRKSTVGEKPTDTTHLQKTSNIKLLDIPAYHPAASMSGDNLQIERRESSPSQVNSLQAPMDILPRTACPMNHCDPRLSSGRPQAASCLPARPATEGSQACSDHTTRPPTSSPLPSCRLDDRDPALFGPPQDPGLVVDDQDSGRMCPLVVIFPVTDYGMGFSIDPRLADPTTPVVRFDEIMELPFYRQLQGGPSSVQPGVLPPNPRSGLLNPKNRSTASRVNQCSRSRAIPPSPSTPSGTPQHTPASLLVPGEGHEDRVLPITSGLGALNTLAPFAKRQSGKALSFGAQKSASLEPAQSARDILQNMTTRKPPGIAKVTVDTGSSAASSSQNPEDSPSASQTSAKSEILCKRKRDEAHCNLADQLSHPSPATRTFAASNLVSRDQLAEPCTRTNRTTTSDERVASQSSPTRKSLVPSSSSRESPVRRLLPSLAGAGLDGDRSSDQPPRKKAKCSESSVALSDEVSKDASNGSELVNSSVPPSACSPDALGSSASQPLRQTVMKKARATQLQQLLREASQPEFLLDSVSSSQLGRISKTASDILVARARVTRSSSRRSTSDERLAN